ncbi:MAG: mechanosensitive ion channel family protein [Desulfobacteraceae bacterium]|nr:mechanosensitive ion channel family protein [Desulfobacteraceae bacterium]
MSGVRNFRNKAIFIFSTAFLLYLNSSSLPCIVSSAKAQESKNKNPSQHIIRQIAVRSSVESYKFESVGEKAAQEIDDFAEKTASYAGSKINTKVIFGISWLKLFFSFLILLSFAIVERIVRLFIKYRKKPEEPGKIDWSARDYFLSAMAGPLSLCLYVYGFYAAMTPLFVHFKQEDGSSTIHFIVQKGVSLLTTVAIIWFIVKLVGLLDFKLKNWAQTTQNTIDNMLAPMLTKVLRIFVIIIGSIIIIQNLTGVKIGPLLASLGVGGIAIALAAKDSIANFFGTLTIMFDKPFQIGDRIIIDSYDGVVQDIGFRSTRIRLLTGHLVTIPNEKIVNQGLENIGKRPHIRWLNNLTLTYDTPAVKLERALEVLKEILADHEGMDPEFPPRVYFNGFNDWSLNILVAVWYHPPNYWDMQAWQQRTCFQILNRFNEEGIEFAFPSQTVYMANDDARQLKLELLKGGTFT